MPSELKRLDMSLERDDISDLQLRDLQKHAATLEHRVRLTIKWAESPKYGFQSTRFRKSFNQMKEDAHRLETLLNVFWHILWNKTHRERHQRRGRQEEVGEH